MNKEKVLGKFYSPSGGGPCGAEYGVIKQLPNDTLDVEIHERRKFRSWSEENAWVQPKLTEGMFIESNLGMELNEIVTANPNMNFIFVRKTFDGWKIRE